MKKPLPAIMAIKEARQRAGLTQAALADKVGISVQYVRSIEGGFRAVSDEVKRRLAEALGYSVWALFPEVKSKARLDPFKLLQSVHGSALIIRDREVPMYKEVLSRISEGQFDELIMSGMLPSDVQRLIRKWAKDMNIEVIR